MYFSVVIPTYSDTERLIKLLNALDQQGFKDFSWEVIVVNNNSNDELVIKKDYSFPLVLEKEIKPGSNTARNKGIKCAKGKVIAFIDSDCVPEEKWLEVAKQWFERDYKKEIGILTGPVSLFFKDPKNLTNAEVYEKYTGFTTEVYSKEGHAITANWFSYKSILEEYGGFNDALKSNGDSELSGKISKKYRIVYEPDLIVHHPARFLTADLVNKYKRLLGGAYTRKFQRKKIGFFIYTIDFILRRYRFSIKKLFTVSLHESWAIFKVCNAINYGVVKEYLSLVSGKETKR